MKPEETMTVQNNSTVSQSISDLERIEEELLRTQALTEQDYLSIIEDKDEPMEVPRTKPEPTTQMTPEAAVTSKNRIETPKEIGINKPTPFNGDRTKVHSFIQECKVYLAINRRVYTTDEAKIVFILSYITEKEALKWKEIYLMSLTNDEGDIIFPTIKEFWSLI